jgi:uncharacterized protein YbcI
MKQPKPELKQELKEIVTRFLNEQLGEFPRSVQIKFWDNMCIIRAVNALTAAEVKLIKNSTNSLLFQNFKNRQFEEVAAILKAELEKAAGCEAPGMDFFISKNNTQFLIITFGANL